MGIMLAHLGDAQHDAAGLVSDSASLLLSTTSELGLVETTHAQNLG